MRSRDQGVPASPSGLRPSGAEPAAQSQAEPLVPNAGLTARASEFLRANRSHPIVSGAWLDKDRRRVSGPPETWVKLRYRFSNGQQITLNQADRQGLLSMGYEPVWWGDSRDTIAKAVQP